MCSRRRSQPETLPAAVKPGNEIQYPPLPRESQHGEAQYQTPQHPELGHVPAPTYSSLISYTQPSTACASLPIQIAREQ